MAALTAGIAARTVREPVPKKKTHLSEAERTKRIRETAKTIGTSDDPKDLERAIKRVAPLKAQKDA